MTGRRTGQTPCTRAGLPSRSRRSGNARRFTSGDRVIRRAAVPRRAGQVLKVRVAAIGLRRRRRPTLVVVSQALPEAAATRESRRHYRKERCAVATDLPAAVLARSRPPWRSELVRRLLNERTPSQRRAGDHRAGRRQVLKHQGKVDDFVKEFNTDDRRTRRSIGPVLASTTAIAAHYRGLPELTTLFTARPPP